MCSTALSSYRLVLFYFHLGCINVYVSAVKQHFTSLQMSAPFKNIFVLTFQIQGYKIVENFQKIFQFIDHSVSYPEIKSQWRTNTSRYFQRFFSIQKAINFAGTGIIPSLDRLYPIIRLLSTLSVNFSFISYSLQIALLG